MPTTTTSLGDENVRRAYANTLINNAWQQQLMNGANIANTGVNTALGLTIGTGLGNWLGNKFWNYQRAQDDVLRTKMNHPVVKAAIDKLFDVDLGYKPPQNPFPTTRAEYLAGVGTFKPNWKQKMLDEMYPTDWLANPNLTPSWKYSQPADNRPVVSEPFQNVSPYPNQTKVNGYTRPWY